MYTGNGVAAVFPLPGGADGSKVYLTPPGGAAIRLKEGDAYTVENGTVAFAVPPPAGWAVSFEEAETARADVYCVVLYSDGTIRELKQDPWELLMQTQAALSEAKAELKSAREERQAAEALVSGKAAAVAALAQEATAALEAKLLNYGALAEAAVKTAAAGARDELANRLTAELKELKAQAASVTRVKNDAEAATDRAEKAALTAADVAVKAATDTLRSICGDALATWEQIKALKPELEALAAQAKTAANDAAGNALATFTTQADAILELLGDTRARLARDVENEAARQERRRSEELEEMRRLRDEAAGMARRAGQLEGRAQTAMERAAEAEGRAREHSERAAALENARNARARRRKGETENG